MTHHYEAKTVLHAFQAGDQVLVSIPGSDLSARFSGPYVVQKKLSETDYVICSPERKRQSRVCHVNMLKAFHLRESPLRKHPHLLFLLLQ